MPAEDTGEENTETRPITVQRKANELREQASRVDKQRRWFLIGGSAVLVIGIIIAFVVTVIGGQHSAESAPANTVNGGVVIGANLIVGAVSTPSTGAVESSATPTVSVVTYLDYSCLECAGFISANGDHLREWVSSGHVSLTIVPVAYSLSQYSIAAANAAACVANYVPNSFFDFNASMFAANSDGTLVKDTDALVQLAEQAAGVPSDALSSCITGQTYKAWVVAQTNSVTASRSGDESHPLSGVPMIVVNGQVFDGEVTDPIAFSSFVLQTESAGVASASASASAAG